MTPGDRWSNDRLDDLAAQVRMTASLTTLVATHDAKIDGLGDDVSAIQAQHGKDLRRIEKLIIEVRDECRANANAGRWTPTQWAAVLGPTGAALIGLAAVLLGGH